MPILSELSVSEVSELRREAGAFQTHADGLKRITDQMFSTVEGTTSVWSGIDQAAYKEKFDGLRTVTERIYRMTADYNTRLNSIADSYQRALDENAAVTNSLKPDIDLK